MTHALLEFRCLPMALQQRGGPVVHAALSGSNVM